MQFYAHIYNLCNLTKTKNMDSIQKFGLINYYNLLISSVIFLDI